MRTRLSALVLITAVLFLTGCKNGTLTDVEEIHQSLEEAKRLWKSHEIHSYTVEVEQYCFCGGPIRYRMTVRNGEVEGVTDLDTGEPFEYYEGFFTISEWFDWLDQATERNPMKLELKFNSQYGFPTFVDYDQSKNISDEEMRLVFKNLAEL